MKKPNSTDWIDDFISQNEFSDEAIYAFLDRALIKFQVKTSHRLKGYMQQQEELHRLHCYQETILSSKR